MDISRRWDFAFADRWLAQGVIRRIGADNKAALARCGESRHAHPHACHQSLDGKCIGDGNWCSAPKRRGWMKCRSGDIAIHQNSRGRSRARRCLRNGIARGTTGLLSHPQYVQSEESPGRGAGHEPDPSGGSPRHHLPTNPKHDKGSNRLSAVVLHELLWLFDVPVQFFFDGGGPARQQGNRRGRSAHQLRCILEGTKVVTAFEKAGPELRRLLAQDIEAMVRVASR